MTKLSIEFQKRKVNNLSNDHLKNLQTMKINKNNKFMEAASPQKGSENFNTWKLDQIIHKRVCVIQNQMASILTMLTMGHAKVMLNSSSCS